MKVLFIVHDGISHEPLGLEYISASLIKAGHETKACIQSKALETVGSWWPEFVAFQVITGDQNRWAFCASEIKKKFPWIKTIFGGPHYLFFAKSQQPEADYVIRGDGEESIIQAIEGKSYVDFSLIGDRDANPHPDRSLFFNDDFPAIKNNVIRNEIACLGCPYKCTYCFNSNTNWQKMVGSGKSRLRYHSPEWIIEDIERMFTDYGGELVSFADDIFGIDLEWLEEFTRKYQKLRIPFFAQLRPRLITEDRVKLIKEAGVHIISFAIENGNEKTRKEILDRDEPNELIEKGCKLLHRYGIKFRMQNMLGLPVDNPLDDALETLRFNIKTKPSLSWCSLLQPYPGTAIADYVVKKGFVKSMNDLIPMIDSTFFNSVFLPIKDSEKIVRLHRYWSAIVRWPWLYYIARILIHFNLGIRFTNWIFEISKEYINNREYWRVDKAFVRHVSLQSLDRLGNDLPKDRKKEALVC